MNMSWCPLPCMGKKHCAVNTWTIYVIVSCQALSLLFIRWTASGGQRYSIVYRCTMTYLLQPPDGFIIQTRHVRDIQLLCISCRGQWLLYIARFTS